MIINPVVLIDLCDFRVLFAFYYSKEEYPKPALLHTLRDNA